MKKNVLLFALLLVFSQFSFAQISSVKGTVTSAENGEPVPGVSVLVKGTTKGAVTNLDGQYSLELPDDGEVLVFSFIGMATEEEPIDGRSVVDVVMTSDVKALNEVVVTALNVSRDESSLGYAIQSVDGDKLSSVREANVVGSLAGKVAGVQVIGSSGAALGGSQNIRLRGINSLSGGSPLFVVDGTPISNRSFSPDEDYSGRDYGNLAADINPDDIESISVLKGPSAAALYGNRAANGVIIITTKKGTERKGIGVEINHSTTFEKVYILPDYQNEYAGGYSQELASFEYNPDTHPASWAEFDGQPVINYAADESWGPRMEGQMVRHWDSWYEGESFGELRPLLPNENNVRDFFETGVTMNTGVALSGGDEETLFRLSLNHIDQKGVMPGSELLKNNVSFNGSTMLTDKLKASLNFNFTSTQGQGRPASGYTGRNPVNSFNQWFQRQLDMDRLENYKNPDGTYRTWNIRSPSNTRPLYWDNPYYEAYENAPNDKRDRVYGNFGLTYDFTENFSVSGFARTDFFNQKIEERVASGGLDLDEYYVSTRIGREDNYEVLAQYDKNFGGFSVVANAGGNIRRNFYDTMGEQTEGGLSVPGFYNIDASIDRPDVSNFYSEKTVRSVYGSLSLGYMSTIFLDLTARNDWSSALPENNNSYFYPSISTSFVFTELMGNTNFLNFGKLRLSYAQVGSDVSAYDIAQVYNVGTPYGSLPALTVPNTYPNPNLRPALSSSYEAGVDLRFLQRRLGLDVTYYRNDNKDQIIDLTVPGSSGITEAKVNAGNIRSEGVEVMLTATPVTNQDFTWDMNLNFARNTNEVIELYQDQENRQLQSAYWGMTLNAKVGEPWGTLIGTGYTYDEETGLPVINDDGSYVKNQNQELGTVLPDFTGGFRNTFTYKNFDLTAFLDFQKGGQFYSVTKMFLPYSGLAAETAGLNDLGNPKRDPVDQGGGIPVTGVVEGEGVQTIYVDPSEHYKGLFGVHEEYIYDASYVKLREVRLGYTLPSKLLAKWPIHSANVAFIAKNLWLIHSNVDGLDPSEFAAGGNGYSYFEAGLLPGVRSYGFNIRVVL
ncbi:SusC/RagA family TonB-linked outer membrane protein [Echinicola strongylocentroti]|uniref:SusC/RagA family TonB-linked outer membrane protein n=1 Tax=Echinicola strongylocentroti TaxID=1795355 RepID=A0A2Z4IJA0_9BACT|nr:SusC/RagA family TonB-linked outer membrane protein [Echinicola strongylocentroti]AWW30483.1 SusC/RagA family TonB-linked outer membrane protein [Echinicola strongylocentroti]